jgi:hypothetical protein
MACKIKIKLGPARRMYVERLLERGLSGNTFDEVVDTIFCRGLQELVPAEWMREAVDLAERRRAARR